MPSKGKGANIRFGTYRITSDALVTVQMRLTNIYNEPFDLQFGICNSYYGYDKDRRCSGRTVLDSFTIPNNSFAIYTFKHDANYYYIQSENFEVAHPLSFSVSSIVTLSFIGGDNSDEEKQKSIYFNSFIVSLNLKKHILSITGHAHNFCSSKECATIYDGGCSGGTCSRYSYYYGYIAFSECNYNGCVPGSYCDGSQICTECDEQCKSCTTGNMNCKSCYITAVYPFWTYHAQSSYTGPCTFEFYPLNKVESHDINVPIPLSHRMTFEFWIHIHDPQLLSNNKVQPSVSSFILQDFFSISVHQNTKDKNSAIFVLVPFEFFFPFDKNLVLMDDFYNKYLKVYPAIQYVKLEIKEVTSKWIYIRGGISYPHKKMFINGKERDLKAFPFYYQNDKINHYFLMRKFYRKSDTTLLRIQGFQYLGTDIYVRNFNLYSEYMYNKVNNPNYFNLHTISDITIYPQLIFSVPFTNVDVDSKNLKIKYKMYDFSGQLNTEQTEVVKKDVTGNLIRSKLFPKKNFYRLNFLSFGNNQFKSSDLLQTGTTPIECSSSEKKFYCYDDGQPYICQPGNSLMALYEKKIEEVNLTNSSDILIESDLESDTYMSDSAFETSTTMPEEKEEDVEEPRKNFSFCVPKCIQNDTDGIEHQFMRLPNIKRNQISKGRFSTDMCLYECDSSFVEYCPSSFSDDIDKFKCKENESFFSYFYHCIDGKKYPSGESALQFSGTINTKSMIFPFHKDYSNFYIEIWFHPDLLTQETKPAINKYFFATNNHHMYWDVNTQQLMLKAFNDNNRAETLKLNQKISFYGWNHLIFYAYEETDKNTLYTKFSLSLANEFIYIGHILGKSTANKICFCNTDLNCCDRLNKVTWMDLFIREIKVWDSNFVQFFTMNDFNKYNYIIPGGLLHMYNLTAASIDHNIIKDLIHPDDVNYNVQFPSDDKEINPDSDMNFNLAWNFNWNDINYPKYITTADIRKDLNRVQILNYNECYKGCLKCFGSESFNCYSCQPGYALIDSTCIRNRDDSSIYYYMNPLKKINETFIVNDLELNFTSLNLTDYATITLHFYIKIYGFSQEQIECYTNGTTDLFKLITFSENSKFIL